MDSPKDTKLIPRRFYDPESFDEKYFIVLIGCHRKYLVCHEDRVRLLGDREEGKGDASLRFAFQILYPVLNRRSQQYALMVRPVTGKVLRNLTEMVADESRLDPLLGILR